MALEPRRYEQELERQMAPVKEIIDRKKSEPLTPLSRRTLRNGEAEDARNSAARYGRGNVHLQVGAFQTIEDFENEREDLRQRPLPEMPKG